MTSRHQDEDFSILLPTLNEADNIEQMIEKIIRVRLVLSCVANLVTIFNNGPTKRMMSQVIM